MSGKLELWHGAPFRFQSHPKDYKDRYEALTGLSLKTCPLCRCGNMVVV